MEQDYRSYVEILEDTDVGRHGEDLINVPRPCFYMLRILGMWQPKSCHYIFKLYNRLMIIIWFLVIFFIIMLSYYPKSMFEPTAIANSVGTILDFCCPFWFMRYYFYYGNFTYLMRYVYLKSQPGDYITLKKLRHIYTFISFIMWLSFGIFFVFHWKPFFTNDKLPYYVMALIYTAVAILTMGWWGTWLTIYGFVCHIHCHQILLFKRYMEQQLLNRNRRDSEHIAHLLNQFNELHLWVEQTQKDFKKIISFAVAYHIFDVFVFSYAFWKGSFDTIDKKYPIGQYIGAIFYDTISISIKLYPAAVLSRSIDQFVISAGEVCTVADGTEIIPRERLLFYRHVFLRVTDMGFQILGLKITLKLTIGIFISLITAIVTFLMCVLPQRAYTAAS